MYHKPHQQPTYGRSKLQNGTSEPGDELVGEWPRDALIRMDARFCARLSRAIARGAERPKDEKRT